MSLTNHTLRKPVICDVRKTVDLPVEPGRQFPTSLSRGKPCPRADGRQRGVVRSSHLGRSTGPEGRPTGPDSPGDGTDVYNAEYGIWRPVYNRHAYRDVRFDPVPDKTQYAFTEGSPPTDEAAFSQPVDDLPPATVITHVTRLPSGRLIVRGTTSDNDRVKRVLVNEQEAKAASPKFCPMGNHTPGRQWRVESHSSRRGCVAKHRTNETRRDA